MISHKQWQGIGIDRALSEGLGSNRTRRQPSTTARRPLVEPLAGGGEQTKKGGDGRQAGKEGNPKGAKKEPAERKPHPRTYEEMDESLGLDYVGW